VARRRGRALKVLALVLLVLAAVLIAVDRVGNYVAERVAANTIKSSQDLPSTPDVDIGGFPFLTQLIARDFDEVTITAHDVPINRNADVLDLSRLQVTLHHVTAPIDLSSVHAESATADATVSYAELSKRLGAQISYAGDGRIKATKSVTIGGQTVTLQLSAAPVIVNGALSFTKTVINGLGSLQDRLPDSIRQLFERRISLQGFPFDLQIQSLRVGADGVELTLTGNDLTYDRSST
jgi:hypothetical protein